MPCYQLNTQPPGFYKIGSGGFASEAECLEACKEGACCESDGTCNVRPQCQCQGEGQAFRGVGTVCVPNQCPLRPACLCQRMPATLYCTITTANGESLQDVLNPRPAHAVPMSFALSTMANDSGELCDGKPPCATAADGCGAWPPVPPPDGFIPNRSFWYGPTTCVAGATYAGGYVGRKRTIFGFQGTIPGVVGTCLLFMRTHAALTGSDLWKAQVPVCVLLEQKNCHGVPWELTPGPTVVVAVQMTRQSCSPFLATATIGPGQVGLPTAPGGLSTTVTFTITE